MTGRTGLANSRRTSSDQLRKGPSAPCASSSLLTPQSSVRPLRLKPKKSLGGQKSAAVRAALGRPEDHRRHGTPFVLINRGRYRYPCEEALVVAGRPAAPALHVHLDHRAVGRPVRVLRVAPAQQLDRVCVAALVHYRGAVRSRPPERR